MRKEHPYNDIEKEDNQQTLFQFKRTLKDFVKEEKAERAITVMAEEVIKKGMELEEEKKKRLLEKKPIVFIPIDNIPTPQELEQIPEENRPKIDDEKTRKDWESI